MLGLIFYCGIETCLVVNGKEQGDLIWFDCDGRFSKLTGKSILDLYESWLSNHLSELKKVEGKLQKFTLQEVIDTEWEAGNYSIKEMILSLIGSKRDESINSGAKMDEFLKQEYGKWMKEWA
ncbi:MAG: hypothetical protein ACI81T_004456 [Bacteroidia bacterium]|jgi:hypothetical protein